MEQALALLEKRRQLGGREALDEVGRRILLQTIDDLWTEHGDWGEVAARIRADVALEPPLRRAALNEVLRRAQAEP